MKKLVLSKSESQELLENCSVEIERNNFPIHIEKKITTKTILAAKFEPTKMHIYDVKTTGKHPVHMIEGGEYLTEDETIFNEYSDMGWFFLNQKEYAYFKSQIKEVTINVNA